MMYPYQRFPQAACCLITVFRVSLCSQYSYYTHNLDETTEFQTF